MHSEEGSKPLLVLNITYVSQGMHIILEGSPCNDSQRYIHRKGGLRKRGVQESWGERSVSSKKDTWKVSTWVRLLPEDV